MTQHQCNECGRHVSPTGDYCYGCGSLDPLSRKRRVERNVGLALAIAMFFTLVTLMMSGWLMTLPPEVVQRLFQR